ncbi:hypothetical protein MHO82_24855 [Vibrio sp. Of7-15]|uniref:hypothetical protein n=1 Tax=Vibrio sp. Of7-15 TaxID=2724879 RepID=UPI001EF3406A|nr:hypothetical protein [Vibrio sp. Of7-15]MCG7500098.1 hypothetical protein [Vibrio sp. Of7-15]
MNNQYLRYPAFLKENIEAIVASYAFDKKTEIPAEDTMSQLKKSPLLKILQENRSDGVGTLSEVMFVCRELGKVDASLGWLVGVSNSAWSMRGNFELCDITSASMEENALMSMVLGRPGDLKLAPDGKGWLLSGQWKYSSGFPWSSYFFGLAMAEDNQVRVVVVPSDKLEVVAEWNSSGLVGTQSVMVSASDIYIPEQFAIDYQPIISGEFKKGSVEPSYSRYFTGVLMNCLVGTILGATESALSFVTENAERPIAGSTYTSMSCSGPVRYELGRLSSSLDSLVCLAEYNACVVDNAVHNGMQSLTDAQRVDIRSRATQIMRGCTDIVHSLLWLYGSSGIDKSCPLEKIWRDVNVGARHGGFAKLVPEELAGVTLLGGDPTSISRMF